MKRIFNYLALGLAIVVASSCTKTDNYPAPDQTVQGSIIDMGTGQTLQSEVSGDNGSGTKVRLLEISYSSNPTPLLLATKQDGTYINTKVFAATYKMYAEGAFVPMIQTSPVVDQSQTVEVKGGTTTVDFKVDPFLRIDWVGEPVLNSNGTISVQVKVNRGTTNALFQQNMTDVALFVNTSPYVGNNINDGTRTGRITYSGSSGNAAMGTTLTLTTAGGALATGKDYYVRVAARIDYGLKYYNYTTVKKVVVP